MIKVWDYIPEYKKHRKEFLSAIDEVFKSSTLIFGPKLSEFENKFKKFVGTKYGLGVGNGTDALYIAMKALGIGVGDEVITTSNTAVPTVTAIVNVGATPVFVDVDKYYLINTKLIKSKITKKTKAIIPVHLYGQACDMDAINKIAKKNDIHIIEDCAQSHGAEYKGKKTGSLGDVGCFSFYPTKILGTYGDAGFITTNNEKIFDKMMRIRFLGMERKKMSSGHWNGQYYAVEHGTNSRLDEIHAAILLIKLKNLHKSIKKRQKIAKIYDRELKNTDLILPKTNTQNKHAYYVYVVQHKDRDKIMSELIKKDIHLNISYPWPIHIMEPYKKFAKKMSCFDCSKCKLTCLDNTSIFSKKIFSLPMYPELTLKDQLYTIKSIKKTLLNLS